jgi:hypothetical protein
MRWDTPPPLALGHIGERRRHPATDRHDTEGRCDMETVKEIVEAQAAEREDALLDEFNLLISAEYDT